jgi:hypothetical protein
MAEQLRLDWSTAVVSDGKLTVGFSAKPPKKWRETFALTTALLSQGQWDATLNSRNGTVQVATVEAGDEERVRQFLEGAVLEANSTLVSEDELFADGTDDDDGGEDAPAEPSRDEELTERFRAFAESPS